MLFVFGGLFCVFISRGREGLKGGKGREDSGVYNEEGEGGLVGGGVSCVVKGIDLKVV